MEKIVSEKKKTKKRSIKKAELKALPDPVEQTQAPHVVINLMEELVDPAGFHIVDSNGEKRTVGSALLEALVMELPASNQKLSVLVCTLYAKVHGILRDLSEDNTKSPVMDLSAQEIEAIDFLVSHKFGKAPLMMFAVSQTIKLVPQDK